MSTTISVKFTGIDKTRVEIERLARLIPGSYEAALKEVGEDIKAQSMEIVPFDLGTLHGSAFVNDPEGEGFGASVTIGYGGAAAGYAERQHEDTTLNHKKGRGKQRRAKYLEEPFLRKSRQLGPNILKKIKQRWGAGV